MEALATFGNCGDGVRVLYYFRCRGQRFEREQALQLAAVGFRQTYYPSLNLIRGSCMLRKIQDFHFSLLKKNFDVYVLGKKTPNSKEARGFSHLYTLSDRGRCSAMRDTTA
jgi:hypothetical protein